MRCECVCVCVFPRSGSLPGGWSVRWLVGWLASPASPSLGTYGLGLPVGKPQATAKPGAQHKKPLRAKWNLSPLKIWELVFQQTSGTGTHGEVLLGSLSSCTLCTKTARWMCLPVSKRPTASKPRLSTSLAMSMPKMTIGVLVGCFGGSIDGLVYLVV